MKNIMLVISTMVLMGCSANYLENPKYFVKDPYFDSYLVKKSAIEKLYLGKEISYAQYLQELKLLDQDYSKQAQARETAIGQ